MPIGSTFHAFATLKDESGHLYTVAGDTVAWSSSNTDVATISSKTGMVTAVAPGKATITAKLGFTTGSKELVVDNTTPSAAPVDTILLTLDSPMMVQQAVAAVAVMKDADGQTLVGRSTTWNSSNTAVAIVSDIGVVTGVGSGTSTISVASGTKSTSISLSVVDAFASLDMQTQPVGAASGVAFTTQPRVNILDGGDRLNTVAALPVTARLASGNGTLSGTLTVNAVNGVATFTDLAITGSGTHMLTFSTIVPALSVASNVVDVAPPPAAKIAIFTQPSATASSGVALDRQPAIQLRDGNDAVLKSPGVPVVASLASGSGTLTGATTVSTDTAGVATFGDLAISGSGTYALKFTSGSAPAVTSSDITLTSALSTTQAVPSVSGTVSQAIAPVVPVTAAGGQAPYSYALSGGTLPAGMTFNQSTGTLSGTPTAVIATTAFTVTVTDASSRTSVKTFQLTVTATAAPLGTAVAVATKSADVARAVAAFAPVTASGGTAPYTFALSPSGTLPAGLNFNGTTGQISGTPTATLGTTTLTVTATDAASQTSSKTFQLTVNPSLSTTQAVASKVSTVSRAIAAFTPVTASGGTAPYSYALSGGALPTGMSFSTSAGAVSGTPSSTLTGGRTYTVTATDGIGATSAKTFTLTINSALTTTQAVATRTGAVNQPITAFTPVTASGGTTPYAFSITGASGATLPAGLTFNTTTGLVAGTPTGAIATTTFTVKATDAAGATSSKTFQLTVTAPTGLSTTQSLANVAGTLNTPLSVTPVTASGGLAPYSFALSGGSLPAGLSFNPTSGQLSGTPTATFTQTTFTVTATDAMSATSSKTFALAVTTEVAPTLLEDFSTYTSTANFLTNPRGIWKMGVDGSGTDRIVLDQSVGYGASSKSMRYDWPNNADGNQNTTIHPGFLYFPGNLTHVWVEFVVRFNPNFAVNAGEAGGAEYKLAAMGSYFGSSGRWNVPEMQEYQFVSGWPGNEAGFITGPTPRDIWDGQPHVFRVEAKLGPNGIFKLWIDGVLMVNQSGFTTDPSHNVIDCFGPGLNLNQGPNFAGMQMWWHKIAMWSNDPGWH